MCRRSCLRWFAALVGGICAIFLPAWLSAQTFDLNRGREALVSLDGPWRFHPGDSPLAAGQPLWAAPGFDDSSWRTIESGRSWSEQGYPGMSGFAWYRFTVVIPAGSRPTSVLLAPIITSYQIFAGGRLVGACGGKLPTAIPATPMNYQMYPLTGSGSPVARTVQVAIRVWHAPLWAGYVGGGSFLPGNLAGDPKLLAAERTHREMTRDVYYVDSYSYSITAALVGLAILCLFFIRPGEREYLWFALVLLAQAADSALFVSFSIFAWPSVTANDLIDGLLVATYIGAAFCFFSRVLDAPAGRLGRVLLGLVTISPFMAVLYWPGWAPASISASIQIACLLPAVVWILWVLVERAWRGNLDARLLLLPTLLDLGFYFADNLAIVLDQAGITRRPRIFEVPLPLPPFTVHLGTLLNLFFLLALLVFLIRRFTIARAQEERMAAEFEAARQVQQVLLPDKPDQCPGFAIECVYQPAEQVGGDFFQQIKDADGGILIVVGDVSGKGLPAAMTVSVLVGAIRTETDHGAGPAELLASLNTRMMGRLPGGFATCLAAHLSADGRITLANAGHLPPYLNGEEIGISGALPLGIAAGVRYDTASLQLHPGDQLMFLSDGVVEAQSKSGELFGFNRTRDLSRSSAAHIAESARAFGQKDDITVVTVAFSGAAVETAAV